MLEEDNSTVRFENLERIGRDATQGTIPIWDQYFDRLMSYNLYNKLYTFYARFARFSLTLKLLSFAPFLIFLVLFDLSPSIPHSIRPPVSTSLLPLLDEVLFFNHAEFIRHLPASLLAPLQLSNNPTCLLLIKILDVYAAFVYLIHFFTPWIFAFFQLLYYRSRRDPASNKLLSNPWSFFFVFGLVNLCALFTQIIFPTSPPWYNMNNHSSAPPSYSTPPSPAGLIRTDQILGISFFAELYNDSPVVFGSWPSMHAAWPLMITIYMPNIKAMKALGIVYAVSVWWAAPYLDHHYAVDIIGGIVYSIIGWKVGGKLWELVRERLGVWGYAKNGEEEVALHLGDLEEGTMEEMEEMEERELSLEEEEMKGLKSEELVEEEERLKNISGEI
eukprot:TRINITY_DN4280_c0_g1_i1.p1 TRINITY_DN4280_c0_g1~~TRINITY_DN4280_c0_g1_i1.p1  ORF type:complete len:388 (+),score=93.18 TRINITY_DN4280_c0_g1_i1:268-1431(+)